MLSDVQQSVATALSERTTVEEVAMMACSVAQPTLDYVARALSLGRIDEPMARLCDVLLTLRTQLGSKWTKESIAALRAHRVRDILLQDPFTARSAAKPRGYPGDAELLDLAYRHGDWPLGTSALGSSIGEYSTNRFAPRSVRWRRDFLARQIDEVTLRRPHPRVLAIACGHLREAKLSEALADGRVGEVVALDQDATSLAVVQAELQGLPIRTVANSIRSLLTGKQSVSGRFDLIYSAGLYDYLSDDVAIALSRRLLEMLDDGGKLLVANFDPSLPDIGYMEVFMEWDLIYRDQAAMRRIHEDLPDVSHVDSYSDSYGHVAFVEVHRR